MPGPTNSSDTCALVSEHGGKLQPQCPRSNNEIRMADTHRLDGHADLSSLRFADVDRFDCERSVGLVEYSCDGLHL